MTTTDLPLRGRTILLARQPHRGQALARRLRGLGARVILRATFDLGEPGDPRPAREALGRLRGYDWLIFTSVSGVRFFFQLAGRFGVGMPARMPRVACIGPATARELHRNGVAVAVVARRNVAEGLAAALRGEVRRGQRALLVRPESAREVLPRLLREYGVIVDAVPFYRNVPAPDLLGTVRELERLRCDAVVFTAPSGLKHLLAAADDEGLGTREVLSRSALVAIGEVTARALEGEGLAVAAVAREPSDAGLVEALCGHFASGG